MLDCGSRYCITVAVQYKNENFAALVRNELRQTEWSKARSIGSQLVNCDVLGEEIKILS